MSAEQIRFREELRGSASGAQVLAELRQLPLGRSARFEQPESSTLMVRTGSRLAYRLLGMLASDDQLPVLWTFTVVDEGDQTKLDVSLTSDAGWYLFWTQMARDAYQARFERVISAMDGRGFARLA